MKNIKAKLKLAGAVSLITFLTSCASSGSNQPETSFDGLQLTKSSRSSALYVAPGVQFSEYQKYGILPCEVSFKKNWLRDQNRSSTGLGNRANQEDMDRIKKALAEQCDKYFKEALLEDPAYDLVEEFTQDESVLILRPNIINLDVNAPDLRSASITRSYTTSAGEMTLYLEFMDATTGDILARAIDAQEALDNITLQVSNSVTNMADANRILRKWGKQLREGMDDALRPEEEN